ncbi:MAG: hypothetical protein H7343_08055 [Undibacterium sp.]|nr:hypothetical protein [Opitutaceae bacterium]
MDDASRIATATQYLRRKYAGDLIGLKRLADTIATNGAFESVTITGQGFEGGQASGALTFEPMAYLGAVEALILELDPTGTPGGPAPTHYADFSRGYLET